MIEAADTPKKILFICVGNAARSQMAEGFARHLGKGKIEPASAGTEPESHVDPKAVAVMAEKGIDMSHQRPKMINLAEAEKADMVITMGCDVEESCPLPLFKEQAVDWDLDDPKGKPLEKYRQIRDDIEKKVIKLLDSI